ncbi:ribosome small subunit-dependent GTPase A [Saccharicrinis sp. 156]|uniref:ribosome small subunit-dependent GTPase A n=1 Tax=Saccharicrinis sp. 156 TaxID=3417574 RepID=UPI003D330567
MSANNILLDLGYHQTLNYTINNDLELARVISEHRERYIVKSVSGEFEAEIIGNLRFSVQSRTDLPAVGDWVSISPYDEGKSLIHEVLPRRNILKRQSVGTKSDEQIIATNIDYAFIVEAVNRDFNINRFERYLTICYNANIEPVLILNKTDLIDKDVLQDYKKQIKTRIPNVQLHTTNCVNNSGLMDLKRLLNRGKTYCFLGSSGVGKSTIINYLYQNELMKTMGISESIDRGKHTTTHRQLIVLKDGGVLIDNPGMREVGLTSVEDGLNQSFAGITELAVNCKFTDCTHKNEKGCAVLNAVETGVLSEESYKNYLRMKRESEHYSESEAEKRRKGKKFAKMVKQVKKHKS